MSQTKPQDVCFEYLDHTADVQIHAWGSTVQEAYLNAALAMYNVLTPIAALNNEDASIVETIEAEGHDAESLLYTFLEECLFRFHVDSIVFSSMKIISFSKEPWRIKAEGRGEIFDRSRHECGTEVKAITYSAMTIEERDDGANLYVIVDI